MPFIGKFYHGPLPLNTFSPAMFTADYELADTPQTKALFDAAQGENPVKGRLSFSYSERITGNITAPNIVYRNDDITVTIQNFTSEYDTDRNGIGKKETAIGLIKIDGNSEVNKNDRYEFSDVRIKTDLNPTQWDYVTSGTQQLNVANIKFSEQHNNGKTETAELKNFESRTDLTEKNDFVDLNVNFKLAELIDSSLPIGSFAVDARVDHLEAATFSDFVKAFSASDQRQMESAVVKLLQNRPHFLIKPFIWANSAGQSQLSLDIDLADTDIIQALRGKVTELFKTFDLSIDVNKAALQSFLTQSAQFRQGLDKIQAEQQANAQMEEIIREWEKDNFAVNRAEAISAELKLTDGKLMLNGKEIPEEQIQMVLFMLMMGGLK